VLLDKANVEKDEGVVPWEDMVKVGPIRHWKREPKVRNLP
jgi:catalase